jgi:hypothetical protein
MIPRKLTTSLAVGATAVAVAVGGFAIGNSGSGNGTPAAANAAQPAAPHQGPQAGQQPQQSGQRSDQSGQIPKNWNPGDGTIITGTAANKAKAAALAANYPGTVNRVMRLSDGTYAVHMFATSGPHHVFVNKDFKVTGAAT